MRTRGKRTERDAKYESLRCSMQTEESYALQIYLGKRVCNYHTFSFQQIYVSSIKEIYLLRQRKCLYMSLFAKRFIY